MLKIIGETQLLLTKPTVPPSTGIQLEIKVSDNNTYSLKQFWDYDPSLVAPHAHSLKFRDRLGTLRLYINQMIREPFGVVASGQGQWEIDEHQLLYTINYPFITGQNDQYSQVFHVSECCEFTMPTPRVIDGLFLTATDYPLDLATYCYRQACFRHLFGCAYETGAWLTSSPQAIEPLITYAAQQTPQFRELMQDHLRSYRGLQGLRTIPPELEALLKENQAQNNSPNIERFHDLLTHPIVKHLNQQIVLLYGRSLREFLGLL